MRNSRLILALIASAFFVFQATAQVGFNNPNPHPSSIVDLTATDKGLLVPRMTSTQRQAISNPANGLLVFDITLKTFCIYDTVANPDKWMMLSAVKADAMPNGNASLEVAGNVGLGVPTPKHKLEVAGNIKSNDTLIATTGKFTGNVNLGVPNPKHKLDVSGNIRATDTVIATTGKFSGTIIANSFSGNGSVPSGAIMMWNGSTPPSGWVICDGSNGTPDLRGRFIVGSGTNANPAPGDLNPTYTVGATGGENKHTLAKSELPKHKHTISSTTTDNGQVTLANASVTDNYSSTAPGSPGFFSPASGTEIHALTNTPSHTHTISGNSGDGTTDGITGQSHENRPPYYVLTYIMKQ